MQTHESSPKYGPLPEGDDLAYFVQRRRQQLQMTCAEAAKLAGLSTSQWKALEAGRFREMHDNISFTLAGTLRVSVDLIRWLAASN